MDQPDSRPSYLTVSSPSHSLVGEALCRGHSASSGEAGGLDVHTGDGSRSHGVKQGGSRGRRWRGRGRGTGWRGSTGERQLPREFVNNPSNPRNFLTTLGSDDACPVNLVVFALLARSRGLSRHVRPSLSHAPEHQRVVVRSEDVSGLDTLSVFAFHVFIPSFVVSCVGPSRVMPFGLAATQLLPS